jgi:predicted CoA-substrate-specific enzyme activase
LSHAIQLTGIDMLKAAKTVVNEALSKAGLSWEDIGGFVATGYGRVSIPFANKQISEITCTAKGVNFFYPEAKLIIDIGGQDTKVIKLDAAGRVAGFAMNDKCAAGTGRFLELAAQTLQVKLEELGDLSMKAKNKVQISSTCTVFAQTEIVSLLATRVAREDIIAGLHEAIASRVFGLVSTLNPQKVESIITGGVARNIGVVRALEGQMGTKLIIPDNPQILTASGAALLGID